MFGKQSYNTFKIYLFKSTNNIPKLELHYFHILKKPFKTINLCLVAGLLIYGVYLFCTFIPTKYRNTFLFNVKTLFLLSNGPTKSWNKLSHLVIKEW